MKKQLFLLFILASILSGCSGSEIASPNTYMVRFWSDGHLLQEQAVVSGETPKSFSPELPGGTVFIGWDTEPAAITADTDFHARFISGLTRHVPFLFSDPDGLLNPDGALTQDDLGSALCALAGDPSALPELPSGSEPVTFSQLQSTLSEFGLTVQTRDDSPLTRSQAAEILNNALGREQETVTIAKDAHGFPDVSSKRKDYAILMESSVPHEAGITKWEKSALATGLEPGWNVSRGKLRMIDNKGYMVTDTVIDDVFTIGADGWYTSGNAELDGLVRERLALIQEQYNETDRMMIFRRAYNYTRDSFMYLRRNPYYPGFTGWEVQDAIDLFKTGRGNCYSYAAMCSVFAKALGYNSIAVSGKLGARPHGWVVLKDDGIYYYCDPELEMSMVKDKNFHFDFFMARRGHIAGIDYDEPWTGF